MNETQPAPARTATIYRILAIVGALVVVADQLTKDLALKGLNDGPVDLISGILTLRLTYNSGGAFGTLQGVPGFFLVATTGVVIMVLFWARRLTERSWAFPLGLVLGGGVGNVIDRAVRDTSGQVVDFIQIHGWPVFNVADSCIVVGVLWLIVLSARAPKQDVTD